MFSIPSLAGLCAGAVTGLFMAWRRKGNGADMAQYAAVCGIIGFLFGIILTIVVQQPGAG